MAQKVELEVEISQDGEVSFTVKGLKGNGCMDLARQLEEALGEVQEKTRTPEYYETRQVLQTTKRTR